MPSPPWAGASSDDLYFVLLTGANSGVGVGIGQRIVDEFLASRPPSSHLILIPTTRSKTKSRDTVLALRELLHQTAHTSKQLQARFGPNYDPQTIIARVHILSIQLDLCDIRSVYAAADQLIHGKVTDPTGVIDDVTIPRIDAALFNAGLGGWEGLDWLGFASQIFTVGLVQSTTYPSFKKALPAAILDSQKLLGADVPKQGSPPELAEVFCANIFGHYVLAHELLPLMSRANASEAPARVVWTSSIDAGHDHLDFDDFQASRYMAPYESSKRISDLISLTADLPSVQEASASYFEAPSMADKPVRPRFYVSHPGIVCTPMFPLNWFLYFWYWLTMHVSRLCGSPWHTVDIYPGACATSWLALADQLALDALGAQYIKWGSSVTRTGRAAPKKTEVEGWGWEGRIEDAEALRLDDADGSLRKTIGRKWDAVTLTKEQRTKFEADGRRCWEELERLRTAWDEALGRKKA
ncbi:putative ERG27-3-keto sterol reductase [Rosellinia necatrix]|uniref:Putative ERG27-3-keto sterol reductase n=1 Tax=Rosellinia necatrix TaxID=77044 RepID=A0A1W2TG27_ROSNE|nr:putative ERG27-3-keto sterol reductase [Rosellinia necatrix]